MAVSLFELYRPKYLDGIVGQDAAVRQVRTVLARGWGGRAWWITGTSGSGKTTLARIIATHGAVDLAIDELDSQALTPNRIRDIEDGQRFRMLGSKPGKAVIVNEAHGLRKDAIRQLLVALERLPDHACWLFTTTKAGEAKLFDDDVAGDATPLLSRCVEVTLENGAPTCKAFAARAREIAQREGFESLPLSVYVNAVSASGGNMRRLLQRIESGSFRQDVLASLEQQYEAVRSMKGPTGQRRREKLTAAMNAVR